MTAIGDAPKLRAELQAARPAVKHESRPEPEPARTEASVTIETSAKIEEYQGAMGLARDLRQRIVGDQFLALAAQAERQEEGIVTSLVS